MSTVLDLTVLSLQAKIKIEANRLRAALVQACDSQAAIDEMSKDLAGLLQIAKPLPVAEQPLAEPIGYADLSR
jgi:hypothetical protein